MRSVYILSVAVLFVTSFTAMSYAQAGGLGLEPSWVEIALYPGEARTTGFLIKGPPHFLIPGRLLLTLADWKTGLDGLVVYKKPGTLKHSASPWIRVYPEAVTIGSGHMDLIRVIVRVPEDAAPGLYRSAVLVEEKPAGEPSRLEEPLTPKFFHPFTIYVTVRPPALSHGG